MSQHLKTDSNRGKRPRQSAVTVRHRQLDAAAADESIRQFVNHNPFAAVGLALVAGYLMARSINAIR